MKVALPEQMREIDRRAVEEFALPSLLLMENAGRAAADRAAALYPGSGFIALLCGGGNNGGDGLAAARHLHNRGLPVRLLLAARPDDLKGDAAVNLAAARALGLEIESPKTAPELIFGSALVVDALLGTGFRGEPRGEIAAVLRAVQAGGRPVLAVDLPSSLQAETGAAGELTPRCVETVTFGLPKPGLLIYPGRELAGDITVAGISLPSPLLHSGDLKIRWLTAQEVLPLWPARSPSSHKGDSGRVTVIAGSPQFSGAAALCSRAALRAGAGLVTLGVPRSLHPLLASRTPEVMTAPLPETLSGSHSAESLTQIRELLKAGGALAIGPGLGREPSTKGLVTALLKAPGCPSVIDADALNLLAPVRQGSLPPGAVITPHPGEMARLLGTEASEVQSNRLAAAEQAASKWKVVVVLKGAATIVASPDGRISINSSGSPALATGGTGDLLTGIIAACLARGLAPYEAACASVWLHGAAAEQVAGQSGAIGTLAGDVIEALPAALAQLQMGNYPAPCRKIG